MRFSLQFLIALTVLFLAMGAGGQVSSPAAPEPVRLTLDQCLELGLEHNPQIGVAEAQLAQAQGQTMQARAHLYPSLTLSANAVRSNTLPEFKTTDPMMMPTSMPMANPDGGLVPGLPAHIHLLPFPGFEMSNTREGDIYGVKVEAQYALYTGGKVHNGVRAAELNEEAAREELRQSQHELVFNIQQAFYGVLLAQEMIKVVDAAYENVEAHYRQVRAFYEQGYVANLDVLRVEAMMASIRPQQVQARNGVKMARLGLNNLLNVDLTTVVEAVGDLKYEPREIPPPADLYSQALANRPEMRIMRLRREMARRLLDIAEANAHPTVALFANYSWNRGQEMPPHHTLWRDGYQAGVVVNVPLFDGRATDGKVEEARATLRQLEQGSRALELFIKTQVEQAVLALEAAKSMIAAEDENVESNKKSLEVARQRYAVGMVSNIEVMDAQTQLTQAEAQRLQAVYEYNLAWARLQAALGMPDQEGAVR